MKSHSIKLTWFSIKGPRVYKCPDDTPFNRAMFMAELHFKGEYPEEEFLWSEVQVDIFKLC